MRIYHRTTREALDQIWRTGTFTSKENPPYVYFSNRESGQADGYGDAVVVLNVPAHVLRLDDEFPDGERHYAVLVSDINPGDIIGRMVNPGGDA